MFLYEAFDEVLKMHSPEESGTAPYWGIFTADRGPMPAVPVVREWLMRCAVPMEGDNHRTSHMVAFLIDQSYSPSFICF